MSKSKPKKPKSGKRKLTAAEKRKRRQQKQRNQELYEWTFINGKQKRIRRPPTIDGMPVDEFIARNADPLWLLQEGEYELLHQWECERDRNYPFLPPPVDSASSRSGH